MLFSEMPYDAVRLFNAALAFVLLVVLGIRVVRRRDRWPTRGEIFTLLGEAALIFSTLVGSIESALAEHTSPGARTFVMSFGLAWLGLAYVIQYRDDASRRARGKIDYNGRENIEPQ